MSRKSGLDSQHWRKRKETIESDIFATGCCITHETNGLAPSSQVISFTFFLHDILHVIISLIQLVKQRLSRSKLVGIISLTPPCNWTLQTKHTTNGLAPSYQVVINFTCIRLPIHLGTQPCFRYNTQEATTHWLVACQHHLADPLQLDVANKAHNKRVSPVIPGCICFTSIRLPIRLGTQPCFRYNTQETTTHWLVACQHHLADPLQLDVANKAHNKRVSPVIPGCIS